MFIGVTLRVREEGQMSLQYFFYLRIDFLAAELMMRK
jgi:hypothetical protein